MEKIRWTKYRVLVTNKCNYRCPFCHNEGQDKSTKNDFMTLEDFRMLVDLLTTEDIEELNISGGEPFINKHIVNMIEYADTHLKCDISCATNLSLISQSQIKRLARTRVKLNIQFPYVDEESFKESTGNGNKDTILQNIKLCKEANVDVGLNTVVQNADVQKYERIILFAIDNELPLKLLPQIGNRESYKYKDFIIPILNRYSVDFKDKKSGALKWSLKKDGHFTSVLYIDSPCFYNDIKTCRNFAELRIHPNLAAQTCILKDSTIKLHFNQGFQLVKNNYKNYGTTSQFVS